MASKYIEDFRNEAPIGLFAVYEPPGEEPIPAPHYWLAHDAAELTNSVLDAFDVSSSPTFSTDSLKAVVLWYLACESVISLVYKILYSADGQRSKQKLHQKFDWLRKKSEGKVQSEQTSRVRKALMDFIDFRNSLFHDLHHPSTGSQGFANSNFSPTPYHLNEADVIEAGRVSINTLTYLRHLLPGVDLMPISREGKADSFFADKVVGRYKEILAKKGLSTRGNLILENYSLQSFSKRVFAPVIRSHGQKY